MIDLDTLFAYGMEGFGETDPAMLTLLRRELESGSVLADRIDVQSIVVERGSTITDVRGEPYRVDDFSGRSWQHKAICAKAATWLNRLGLQWTAAQRELQYPSGIADVAAVGRCLFIECGDTQARKILQGLRAQQEVAVCSYWGGDYLFRRATPLRPMAALDDWCVARSREIGSGSVASALPSFLNQRSRGGKDE